MGFKSFLENKIWKDSLYFVLLYVSMHKKLTTIADSNYIYYSNQIN